METRANYILIGAFTILGIVGILAFFFAFARVEFDRSLAYYDARFESVAGLSEASDVRFAGLPVGQVVDVRLAPDGDGTVIVRLEVEAATPVRGDSIATIESQGVTGVSFVAIAAGTPETPLLTPVPGDVPEIETGRSVIQSLSEDAPELVAETLAVVRDLGDLFRGENRDRIENIIVNTEEASESFAQTLEDFAAVSGSVEGFVSQIDRFNSVLGDISTDFSAVLASADETLQAWEAVADNATTFLDTGAGTLSTADETLSGASEYINEDLVAATADLRAAIADIRAEIAALSEQGATVLATFSQTGTLANARLTEAAATLAELDGLIAATNLTMTSVTDAATGFSTLMSEDGTALIAETRAMIANADAAAEAVRSTIDESLPTILDNVTAASETVATVAAAVGEDLTEASGRIETLAASAEAALAQATTTFADASVTLDAINTALASGQSALAAAESAFGTAETVMMEDVGALVTRLGTTLDGVDAAVAAVAADLPGISRSVSEASAAAEAAFETLNATVAASSPAVREFAQTGLPQFTELAREARSLAASLDRLIRQIERDPARFFLNTDTPEFRR